MKIAVYLPFVILAACASGPCNNQVRNTEPTPAVSPQSASSSAAPEATKIKVFKADGSRQCGQGKAVDVKVMEKELAKAGVKVLSASKGPDGMMHTQVCGAATGNANIYEINISDLKKAEKLGFSRLEI